MTGYNNVLRGEQRPGNHQHLLEIVIDVHFNVSYDL